LILFQKKESAARLNRLIITVYNKLYMEYEQY